MSKIFKNSIVPLPINPLTVGLLNILILIKLKDCRLERRPPWLTAIKTGNTSAASQPLSSQVAYLVRARSLMSEIYVQLLMVDWNSSAYLDEVSGPFSLPELGQTRKRVLHVY